MQTTINSPRVMEFQYHINWYKLISCTIASVHNYYKNIDVDS
ncbi:MAG: hypothetical protein N4A59_06725 [Marinifilum sp.]|nr:hypothetical protein [Marinifilum sp.]